MAAPLLLLSTPVYAQKSAKVLVQSGNVSFIKDASGYSFALLDKTEIMPGYTIKTGADGYAKCQVLSDGSTFEVFPNSEVVYRRTNSVGDLLNVWLGKVKVMIQHLPGVPNPNNLTTPTALISVRGTVFDVDVEDEDGTTFVAVDEGAVDVHHLLKPSRDVRLNPGSSIKVFPNQPLAPLTDRGGLLYKFYQQTMKGLQEIIYNRPGGAGNPGGGTSGPVNGGNNGDKSKDGSKTTGTGAPTTPGTAAPPTPGTPPGGGGGD
jgi:hypothetical protein